MESKRTDPIYPWIRTDVLESMEKEVELSEACGSNGAALSGLRYFRKIVFFCGLMPQPAEKKRHKIRESTSDGMYKISKF